MTQDGSLPHTLAIHAGRDAAGHEHNPHAHLMISERKNDGIARSPEQWFSRANPTDPAKGGAQKTRMIHGRAWVEHARARWAELTNKTMERLGCEERVDHRSYVRQGIDEEARRHFGPAATHVVSRGPRPHRDRRQRAERHALMSEEQKRAEWEWASGSGTSSGGGSSRDHDESRSR